MNTMIRCGMAWLSLTAACVGSPSTETGDEPGSIVPAPVPIAESAAEPVALTAADIARYEQMEQELSDAAKETEAGAALDKSTVVILVVVAVVVIAVAAGGGGGGGGGY